MSTIRLGAASNIRAFQILSDALNSSNFANPIDAEALEDEFGRFRVWSGNLGALQKGHSSLDYRLRDSPLLSSNALKLLTELEENLTSAFAIVSGSRLPYEQQAKAEKIDEDEHDDFFSEDEEEDCESGAPGTELEMRFREIVDIIDNLYKLSVRIRAPTIKSRSLKAASYQPKDPETGVDILEQYAFFDLHHTREVVRHLRLPQAGEDHVEDDALVDRLSRAITLRRRQFKYWRRHRDKLGSSTMLENLQLDLPSVERPDALHRHDTLEAQVSGPSATAIQEAPSQKTGKTLLSGTEATHHYQSLDDMIDSKSVTSYATTVRDLSGKGIDLPPPPKGADGEKDFECPYCFIICPARYGNGRPWRTHLLQDLQPYICTYQDCEMRSQLFRSRREWSEHEASHRKAWRCPEHPTAVYKSQSGLEEHLRWKHSDSFPESQLHSIIKVGETSTVDMRQSCPICFAPADMEGMGGLQNHIANHLERIAAFALPMPTSDDSDGASGVASRGRTPSTGSHALSEISFGTDSSVDEDEEVKQPASLSSTRASMMREPPSAVTTEEELPTDQGLLSAESLRELPDASQERLDILLTSQVTAAGDSDDFDPEETPAEVEEHMAEMEAFRKYLMTLPGIESVRFYRRYGSWKGHANFKDEDSATMALKLFDKQRYPQINLIKGGDNKSVLKFNMPQQEKLEKIASRAFLPEETEAQSISSASLSYGEADQDGLSPILNPSDVPTLRSLYRSGELLQRDQSFSANDAYNQIIGLCYYDITRLRVDAIVNSANRALKISREAFTLNHKIHKAAGKGLEKECRQLGKKLKVGHAVMTSAYNLPSAHIIHASRPQYSGSKGMGKFNMLTECYRSALKVARDNRLKTVALPCLGAGGCGFPPRVAARIALQEVREFLDVYQDHSFERIIFCVYSEIDEKAYNDFLPVFFPLTHGDLENAVPSESGKDRAVLVAQLLDTSTQVESITRELLDYSEHMPRFPRSILEELAGITSAFHSLKTIFVERRVTISNLIGQASSDIELICTVMQSVCGSVTEIAELAKGKANLKQPSYEEIWDDYNSHLRDSQGLDLMGLLEICQDFVQSLDDIIVRHGTYPHEMTTMRVRLGAWLLKQTGQGEKGVRDQFDEVMYTREFQRDAHIPSRSDVIRLHQIPSIARLYQLGELEQKSTYAKPSIRFNYIVCFIREDITRLEVDVLVNSTDPGFSGMGTLDRTVFRKGGVNMQEACQNFGVCNEGDVKLTEGYLLPAKHVLHAIPPETYRKNTKDVLRQIYREVLHTASSLKATSVAIPCIGTGMLNYPRRDSASLAMEEVKHFIESVEPDSLIERIIFVVYGSNDEFIYKSLLPVFFPPVEINVNRALPASRVSPSPAENTPTSSESSEPPRRSLFGTIGEAFRSVRLGKQPVAQPNTRSLQPGEEHAVITFERHAQDCPICSNMQSVYNEGRFLCPDGYGIAQLVLQYLFMKKDQSVYAIHLEGGKRVCVDIPPEFPLTWELLSTVEKSFRDGQRSQPWVSPNLPYPGPFDPMAQPNAPPPGVTIYNAEVTIPIEPEKAIASVHTLSYESRSWEPLHPYECSLHIFPGKLRVYETEHQHEAQAPLLSLELTPLVSFQKYTSSEVMIEKARTFDESVVKSPGEILLKCRTQMDGEMLFQSLKNAARNNQTFTAHRSVQDQAEATPSEAGDSTNLDLLSVPLDPPLLADLKRQIDRMEEARDGRPQQDEPRSGPEGNSKGLRGGISSDASSAQTPGTSNLGQRVLAHLNALPQPNAGLHQEQLAKELGADVSDIVRVIRYLKDFNLIHPVFGDDQAWVATKSMEPVPTLAQQRPRVNIKATDDNFETASHSPPNLSPQNPRGEDLDELLAGLSTMGLVTRRKDQNL